MYNAKLDVSQGITDDNLNNIIKIGIAYNSKFFDFGLTSTLPSLSLFGVGKAYTNWYFTNTTQYVNQNYLVFSKEDKLKIIYNASLE